MWLLLLLGVPLSVTTAEGNVTILPTAFLHDLLQRYGDNEVLVLHQLKALLNRLDIGVGSASIPTGHSTNNLSKTLPVNETEPDSGFQLFFAFPKLDSHFGVPAFGNLLLNHLLFWSEKLQTVPFRIITVNPITEGLESHVDQISRIDSATFKNICPTILQQLESGACAAEKQENEENEATVLLKPTPSE
eukprot:g35315.t1